MTYTNAWNELKVNEPWTRLRHLRVIVVLDIGGLLLLRLLMKLLVLMSIERSTGHNTVGLLGGLGTLYWAWALREGPLGQEGCQVRPLADYNTSSTLVDRRARPPSHRTRLYSLTQCAILTYPSPQISTATRIKGMFNYSALRPLERRFFAPKATRRQED